MAKKTGHLTVMPADGKCEGCGAPIGEEIYETDDVWNSI